MVYEKRAGCGWLGGGVEGPRKRLEDGSNIFVQITDLASDGTDQFSLVGRQMSKRLRSFGMLHLLAVSSAVGEVVC